MKKIIFSLVVAFAGIGYCFAQQPYVQTVPYITSGLSKPVEIIHCNDDRLFIVEQDGRIRIVMNDVLLTTPFLDINPQVLSTGTEQGLLGLAFDPEYKSNGYFFVNYINNSGNTVISRFSTNPLDSNLADPSSEVVLMTVNQPYTNHNGGDIEFVGMVISTFRWAMVEVPMIRKTERRTRKNDSEKSSGLMSDMAVVISFHRIILM